MFTGTRELLEQVTDAISAELDSIEGMAARNRPGTQNRGAARSAPIRSDDCLNRKCLLRLLMSTDGGCLLVLVLAYIARMQSMKGGNSKRFHRQPVHVYDTISMVPHTSLLG